MARKSRKNIVVEEVLQPREKVWRAALYIRLSVEFNQSVGNPITETVALHPPVRGVQQQSRGLPGNSEADHGGVYHALSRY